MNLVGYTATALSRNDIIDTPTNKNVVDFAIVELKDLQGNLVVMYDDAEGLNPETQKTCDTNGQVTFFAEIGDYDLEINGKAQRINLAANIADYIKLETGESVQEFADSFALKIFQSPTGGGLTEIQTRTANANEVYKVRKTSDNSLAAIYSDAAGTTEIAQNGTDNKSGSDGVVSFYINSGSFYVESGGATSNFNTLGTAAIADITESTTDTTRGRALKVRDGGLLSPSLSSEKVIVGDFLAVVETLPTGIYSVFKPDLTANIPTGLNDRAVVTVRQYNFSDTYVTLIDNIGREMSISRWNGNWGDWSVNVTDNNFNSQLAGAVSPVSFTPVLSGGTTAGEYNPLIASGMSYKIDNLVTVFISFQNTQVITQGTGVIKVSGFPEQVSYDNTMFYAATGAVYFQNVKSGGVVKHPIVWAIRGSNEAHLHTQDTTGGDDFPALQIEEVLDDQTRFGFTVTYMAQ